MTRRHTPRPVVDWCSAGRQDRRRGADRVIAPDGVAPRLAGPPTTGDRRYWPGDHCDHRPRPARRLPPRPGSPPGLPGAGQRDPGAGRSRRGRGPERRAGRRPGRRRRAARLPVSAPAPAWPSSPVAGSGSPPSRGSRSNRSRSSSPSSLPAAVAGWSLGEVHAAVELDLFVDLFAPPPAGVEAIALDAASDQLITLSPTLADFRTVLLVGPGVRRAGQMPAVAEAARRTGATVVTTLGAVGSLALDDPAWGGVVGLQVDDVALSGLADAELVIAVGVDPTEAVDLLPDDAQVLDVEPWHLGLMALHWPDPTEAPPTSELVERLGDVARLPPDPTLPLSPIRATVEVAGAVSRRGAPPRRRRSRRPVAGTWAGAERGHRRGPGASGPWLRRRRRTDRWTRRSARHRRHHRSGRPAQRGAPRPRRVARRAPRPGGVGR